jgi:hypothetical protein
MSIRFIPFGCHLPIPSEPIHAPAAKFRTFGHYDFCHVSKPRWGRDDEGTGSKPAISKDGSGTDG